MQGLSTNSRAICQILPFCHISTGRLPLPSGVEGGALWAQEFVQVLPGGARLERESHCLQPCNTWEPEQDLRLHQKTLLRPAQAAGAV